MIRTIAAVIGLGAMLQLAACSGDSVSAADVAAEAPEVQQSHSVENEDFDFGYSYPAEAAAVPQVKAFLERDRRGAQRDLKKQAAEAKADAEANGYPYFPHYLVVGWEVGADLPGWLSMSAAIETYSGGAHGNQAFDGMLWDKKALRMRKPTNLFRSKEALRQAIQPDFCRLLDAERAERRGEPVPPDSDDIFDECIDPLESTVVLASEGGKAFDAIDVLVAPYAAGPYVEGSYVISVPVTDEVIAALKPEFRSAFAAEP